MAKRKAAPDPNEQARKFRQLARELGTDESEAAFEEKLKAIAKAKPDAKKGETKRAPR